MRRTSSWMAGAGYLKEGAMLQAGQKRMCNEIKTVGTETKFKTSARYVLPEARVRLRQLRAG